jgi:energy-coupling factor transporter transmembrane protein EcfT
MMTLILAIVLFLLGAIFLFALVNPYYRERHLYIYLDFRNRFFLSALKFMALLIAGLAFIGGAYYALDLTINSGFFR